MFEIRLQKYMADQGMASRRKAEALIRAGHVLVNGVPARLGMMIDPDQVTVTLREDGVLPIAEETGFQYIALNKPVDYATSTLAETSASSLLTEPNNVGKDQRAVRGEVYVADHLATEAEGLVILTTDREFCDQLKQAPVEKEYEVTIAERLDKKIRALLETGMIIDGERYHAMDIMNVSNRGKRTVITIAIINEKTDHLKKMFTSVGLTVVALRRKRIGKVSLGTMTQGRWKYIRKDHLV